MAKADVIFNIKADSSQAQSEIKKVRGDVGGLDTSASGITKTFKDLSGAAVIVGGALAGIGAAAVAVTSAIWNLSKVSAAYGSAISDASVRTGLGAHSITALKFAAEQGGSSFEAITGSVSKFNVLMGEAALGNEKAIATLERFNITTTDMEAGLSQAIQTIHAEQDATKKAAIAKALFKDEAGKVIQTIDAMNGDLDAAKKRVTALGIAMTDEGVRAADEFDDMLKQLGQQAEATGRAFVGEFLPELTFAMRSASREVAGHQSVAVYWGKVVGDIISGMGSAYRGLSAVISGHLALINKALGTNISATIDWANVVLANLGIVGQGLAALRVIGQNTGGLIGGLGGTANIPTGVGGAIPRGGGGGGRARGGGGGGAKKQDTEFQDAKEREMRLLEDFKAGLERQEAELESHLEKKLISERKYELEMGNIRMRRIEEERNTYLRILEFAKITAKDKEELEHKLGLIRAELATQQIKNATEIAKIDTASMKEYVDEWEKLLKWARELSDLEEKRRKEKNRRNTAADNVVLQERIAEINKMERDRNRGGDSYDFGIGGSLKEFIDQVKTIGPTLKESFQEIGNIGFNAFAQLAEGIGAVIQNFILMGNTGPAAMKKLVASILAGVAAQAAVLSIFELAKGFAALFFNPAEAAAHFKAAALFGAVAIGAGIGGRKLAGDSFNQAAGQATGSGAGQNASQPDAFTTNPNNPFNKALDKVAMVNAQLEETIHDFKTQFGVATPGDVVMRGASDARDAIFESVSDKIADSGAPAAGKMIRNLGWT